MADDNVSAIKSHKMALDKEKAALLALNWNTSPYTYQTKANNP